MNGLRRKCRQTNRNIFRSLRIRRAVLYPLGSVSNNRLAGPHVYHAVFMRDAQRTFEHEGEFIEFWRLPRFDPTARAAHVRDAQARLAGVHAADKFVDEFGLIAGSRDPGWNGDQCWHRVSLRFSLSKPATHTSLV